MRRSILALALVVAACGPPPPGADAAVLEASVDAPSDAASDACALTPCACPAAGTSTVALGTHLVTLYVPTRHTCEEASALVVALDDGEEPIALDALADRDGFVVARPAPDASDAEPWLDAEGRASRADRELVEALVSALGTVMPVDPARVHVVGTGRGARLASRWLFDGALVPAGVGLVDYRGPLDSFPAPRLFARRPRVWASTGARARGYDAQHALLATLEASGYGIAEITVRERDTAEGTPPWLAAELWPWLDRAAWRENGPPEQPWVRVLFPWADASMVSIDALPDGRFVAGAADGRVFDTNASGKWAFRVALGPGSLADVVAGTGAPIFGSTQGLARSDDAVDYARLVAPDLGPMIGLAEHEGRLYGVSFASGLAVSDDRGAHWARVGDRDALVAVAVSPLTGTVLAVGRGASYVRLEAGLAETRPSGSDATALDAVACGADGVWWIVGSAGTVLRSIDDGLTFAAVREPAGSQIADLYCVAVGDDGAMIAAGARGTVVVSVDGSTLRSWPTGGQGYLGAVRWLEPGMAVIMGDSGLVAIGDGLR